MFQLSRKIFSSFREISTLDAMRHIFLLTLLFFEKTFCYPKGFYSPEVAIKPDTMHQYLFKTGMPKMWLKYVQALVENRIKNLGHKYACIPKMIQFLLKKVFSAMRKVKQLNFSHIIPEESEFFWFRRRNFHLFEPYAHYHVVSISLTNRSGI